MYRRLVEWPISRDAYYSSISDGDLDQLVRRIKVQQNPNIGEVMLMAALKVHNVWVQHTRLRASIQRVDYAGEKPFKGEYTLLMALTVYVMASGGRWSFMVE